MVKNLDPLCKKILYSYDGRKRELETFDDSIIKFINLLFDLKFKEADTFFQSNNKLSTSVIEIPLKKKMKDLIINQFEIEKARKILIYSEQKKYLEIKPFLVLIADTKRTHKEVIEENRQAIEEKRQERIRQTIQDLYKTITNTNNISEIIESINHLYSDNELAEEYQRNTNALDVVKEMKGSIENLIRRGEIGIDSHGKYFNPKTTCEGCGCSIPKARLDMDLNSPYCTKCQETYEKFGPLMLHYDEETKELGPSEIPRFLEEKQHEIHKSNAYGYGTDTYKTHWEYLEKQDNEESRRRRLLINNVSMRPPEERKTSTSTGTQIDSQNNEITDTNDLRCNSKKIEIPKLINDLNKIRKNNSLYPTSIDGFDDSLKEKILKKGDYDILIKDIHDEDFKNTYEQSSFTFGLVKDTQEYAFKDESISLDTLNFLFKLYIRYSENQSKLQYELRKDLDACHAIKNAEKIEKAKIEERDRILANMAHSIKNLLASSVIDPLKRLENEDSANSAVIQNALKGADMIRRIINAMNMSYTGSHEDFEFDATHPDSNAIGFRDCVFDSFKTSFSNIFDGNNFGKFQQGYFPRGENPRDQFKLLLEAKKALDAIPKGDLSAMSDYAGKYFLKTNIELDVDENMIFGDAKSSATKFLIMFQEMILNAVKYSSFLDMEERSLSIKVVKGASGVNVEVENAFKEGVNEKSTGLGQVIIRNMVKLMRSECVVTQNGGIFKVEFVIPDFWSKKSDALYSKSNGINSALPIASKKNEDYK